MMAIEKQISFQLDRRNQLLPAVIWSRLHRAASGENSRDEPCDLGFPFNLGFCPVEGKFRMAKTMQRLSSSCCHHAYSHILYI